MQKKSRLLMMSMPTVVSPFDICDLQAVSDSLKATSLRGKQIQKKPPNYLPCKFLCCTNECAIACYTRVKLFE